MQDGTATLKDGHFLTELNIFLLYNLAVALLGIFSKDLKTYIYTKPSTCVFTAALLIIAKTWMQPRCLSDCEWINKLWYIQTMSIIQ